MGLTDLSDMPGDVLLVCKILVRLNSLLFASLSSDSSESLPELESELEDPSWAFEDDGFLFSDMDSEFFLGGDLPEESSP